MYRSFIKLEVSEAELKEIMDEIDKAQETIFKCYGRLQDLGVLTIKTQADSGNFTFKCPKCGQLIKCPICNEEIHSALGAQNALDQDVHSIDRHYQAFSSALNNLNCYNG